MTTPIRFAATAVLATVLASCAPVVDTARLSPVVYPPRPADFRIRMYSTQRPRCSYEELATVRGRKPNLFVSMEDVAESIRRIAREMGGDAVVAVTSGSELRGGTVVGGTVSMDTDPILGGTVIRFKEDDCRE
ncbi:MAG: hypothetical protein M3282_03195 [Gemmatimonadota bacterium]|nr:hypothetical protein [Gemmatimonadota bacterium]